MAWDLAGFRPQLEGSLQIGSSVLPRRGGGCRAWIWPRKANPGWYGFAYLVGLAVVELGRGRHGRVCVAGGSVGTGPWLPGQGPRAVSWRCSRVGAFAGACRRLAAVARGRCGGGLGSTCLSPPPRHVLGGALCFAADGGGWSGVAWMVPYVLRLLW
jgi:hypothetical protein